MGRRGRHRERGLWGGKRASREGGANSEEREEVVSEGNMGRRGRQ